MFRSGVFLSAILALTACQVEVANQPVRTSPQSTVERGSANATQAAILRRPTRCGATDGMSGRRLPPCPTEQEFEAAFGRCYHIVGFASSRSEAEAIVRQTHSGQSGSGAYRMNNGTYGVSYHMSGPRLVMDRHLFSNSVFGPRTVHWHIDRRKSSNDSKTKSDEACVPVDQVAGRTDWSFDSITLASAIANRERREQARREAALRPRPQATYIPSSPSTQGTSASTGVAVDRDGWVRVDGRTLGRVWSSYGWNISCNNGYNSGYGSGSVFGGSFKADVRNRDEATSILLRACRR